MTKVILNTGLTILVDEPFQEIDDLRAFTRGPFIKLTKYCLPNLKQLYKTEPIFVNKFHISIIEES